MGMKEKNVSWPGWTNVGVIGRGGFGTVYEIQRDVLGELEKAALKVISLPKNEEDIEELFSEGMDKESVTNTFQAYLKNIVAEYSLMRKMNDCVNVVNCDDIQYIQHDDGIGWDVFIKMELLTPMLKTLPVKNPEEIALKLGKDICNALVACKNLGIIHRDIKPQNIFISKHGDYKLGDFGIAKSVEKTMGGTKIGTFKYMAPEVYNNQPYNAAADIYSLGLVLYWLLNERRMPFLPLPPAKLDLEMENQARERRLSGEKLPPPALGSDQLKRIVLKACAYDPKDRYATAAEMLRDLSMCANSSGGEKPHCVADTKDAHWEETEETGVLYEETGVLYEETGILCEETGMVFEETVCLGEDNGEMPEEETGILREEIACVFEENFQGSDEETGVLVEEPADLSAGNARSAVAVPVTPVQTRVKPTQKPSRKGWVLAVCAVLVAALAAVVVLFFLKGNKKPQEEPVHNESSVTNINPTEKDRQIVAAGEAYPNIQWELDVEGTLTIGGKGVMTEPGEWSHLAEQVKRIRIQEGIASICDLAFANFTELKTIAIPSSVTWLGNRVFWGSGVEIVEFEGNLPELQIRKDDNSAKSSEGTFDNITATVYYVSENPTVDKLHDADYGGNIEWVITMGEGIQASPVYRLVYLQSAAHCFASSTAKREQLIAEGWCYEGLGWYAPINQGSPVYCLCDHETSQYRYTTDQAERDLLLDEGWKDEGICCYSADEDSVPVYSMFKPDEEGGQYHYTCSTEECDMLINEGWQSMGIAWYALSD